MKSLQVATTAKQRIGERLSRARQERFFRDRLSVTLIAVALVVNILNCIALAFRVRPTGIPVPTHYSNLGGGFNSLGPWYFPFQIIALAIVLTIANGCIAYFSFSRSRLSSLFILATSDVVAFFSFIISMAFGAIK